MAIQHVEFLEGVFVEQVLNALSGGHLALGADDALWRTSPPAIRASALTGLEIGQSFRHCVLHMGQGYPT
jgi:hypothetical protein